MIFDKPRHFLGSARPFSRLREKVAAKPTDEGAAPKRARSATQRVGSDRPLILRCAPPSPAGGRRGSRLAAAAFCLLGFVSLAAAQDAPIDLHSGAGKPAKAARGAPKAVGAVSAADAVRRANSWFEGAHYLNADFVQVAPDGKRSEGKLYVERPGRMLFRFDPPARLEIVADGRSVAVRDQKLNTQDLYFIGQTPLKFLLSDHIDLARDTRVTGVSSDAHAVTIDIEDKATLGGSANISLVFDPATFALKQWTVSDAQGFQTVVTLFNLDLTTQPDPNLFSINEALTTSGVKH